MLICTYIGFFKDLSSLSGKYWFQFIADENLCCQEFDARPKNHISPGLAESALHFIAAATPITMQLSGSKADLPKKLVLLSDKKAGFKLKGIKWSSGTEVH